MTKSRWLRLLVREWPIVLLCLSGASLGTFVTTLLVPLKYDATVHLQVRIYNAPTPFTGADKIMATWAQMVDSPDVLQQAATENGIANPADLASEITVAQEGAQGFTITVSDSQPVAAAKIANSLANALVQRQADVDLNGDAVAQQPLLAAVATAQQQIQTLKSSLANHVAYPPGAPKTVAVQTQLVLWQQQQQQLQVILNEVQSQHTASAASVRIIKAAQPDYTGKLPIFSRNVALSLGLGLALGLGLILLREALDRRVSNVQELRELCPWPLLATMDRQRDQDEQLLAFLHLRDLLGEDDTKTLVVTSAVAGDDVSQVVARLGAMLAGTGEDTLLIDTDIRQPALHRAFDLPMTPGLTDAVLSHRDGQHEVAVARRADHLWVMPAGSAPPNPEYVLTSQALRATLIGLKRGVRARLLLASAAIANHDDALLLAESGMQVLLIVDLATARANQLLRVFARIQATSATVVGCVALAETAQVGGKQPLELAPVNVAVAANEGK